MEKSESRIQFEIFQYFNNGFCLKHHEPRCTIFSVPNELMGVVLGVLKSEGVNARIIKKIQVKIATLFKAMGLKAGVSDLIIIRPGSVVFVEVKTPTGTQSPKQKQFQSIVESMDYQYLIVRGLEDFKRQMEI